MMSQIELSKLYSLISNDEQTFEQISNIFHKEFDINSSKKALTSIIILLEDNLLNITQRIISYFILYDTSQNEKIETSPFLSIILDRLQNSDDKNEQNFLIDFLYKKINYLNMTTKEYLSDNSKEMKINVIQIKMQWDKYYKEFLKQKNININSNDKKRPIFFDRNFTDVININNSSNFSALPDVNSGKELNLNYFKIDYMSFRPINNNFISSEPSILLPNLKHNFLWEKD